MHFNHLALGLLSSVRRVYCMWTWLFKTGQWPVFVVYASFHWCLLYVFFLSFFPVELSPLFPDKLILGLEIRVKVSDYVQDRIRSLRASEQGGYRNVACLRSNAMKYLPNFFAKGQVRQLVPGQQTGFWCLPCVVPPPASSGEEWSHIIMYRVTWRLEIRGRSKLVWRPYTSRKGLVVWNAVHFNVTLQRHCGMDPISLHNVWNHHGILSPWHIEYFSY